MIVMFEMTMDMRPLTSALTMISMTLYRESVFLHV